METWSDNPCKSDTGSREITFTIIFEKLLNIACRDDAVVPFLLGKALHEAALLTRNKEWPEVGAIFIYFYLINFYMDFLVRLLDRFFFACQGPHQA